MRNAVHRSHSRRRRHGCCCDRHSRYSGDGILRRSLSLHLGQPAAACLIVAELDNFVHVYFRRKVTQARRRPDARIRRRRPPPTPSGLRVPKPDARMARFAFGAKVLQTCSIVQRPLRQQRLAYGEPLHLKPALVALGVGREGKTFGRR